MRLLVLQHVPFEGPAAIQQWAEANRHTVSRFNCTTAAQFPEPTSFDCLIIMGGPMSVNDPLPWIAAEIAFIRRIIDTQRHNVIGICLGAQLIAKAMGATVMPNNEREIGWLPVQKCNPVSSTHWAASVFPEQFTPLHWHGDTFTLPANACGLVSSAGCVNQAYTIGNYVLGLQFHLEFDITTASRVAEACADEIAEGGAYVQQAKIILAQSERFTAANQLLFDLLDTMAAAHLANQ